jgi:5-formyltetrahydrofolate cyclo-ligase
VRKTGPAQTTNQPAQPAQTTDAGQPWVCALVYDHELDADIPVDAHDQPVDAACAPSRLVRFDAE